MKIIEVKEETARILVNASLAKLVESANQGLVTKTDVLNEYNDYVERLKYGYARLKADYAKMKEDYARQRAQLDQIAQVLAQKSNDEAIHT